MRGAVGVHIIEECEPRLQGALCQVKNVAVNWCILRMLRDFERVMM